MVREGMDYALSEPSYTLYCVYFDGKIIACMVSFVTAKHAAEAHANYKLMFHPAPNEIEWVSWDNYTIELRSKKKALDTLFENRYNVKYSLDKYSKGTNL